MERPIMFEITTPIDSTCRLWRGFVLSGIGNKSSQLPVSPRQFFGDSVEIDQDEGRSIFRVLSGYVMSHVIQNIKETLPIKLPIGGRKNLLTSSARTDNLVRAGIINDQYLVEELGLTKSFIDRNSRSMGSFSRPRKFFLENVMGYLNRLAARSMEKVNSKTSRQNVVKHEVNRLFQDVMKNRGKKGRK
jgi:hypothetical protein